MGHSRRSLAASILGVAFLWLAPPALAQEPVLSGFRHTAFNLSFDRSSVAQLGNANPDLVFRDVTFGVAVPLTQQLGLWLTVSKAVDFNRDADDRKLTGSFGGGVSYALARRGAVSLHALGGVLSRLERVGDGRLNPTAARLGAKVAYRVLGEPRDERWFGFFLLTGTDFALQNIMSDDGNIKKGDTTYYARVGFEFSL